MSNVVFDNSHLEMGTGSKAKTAVMVCPNCRNGRNVTRQTIGVCCARCGNYFNKEASLDAEEALYFDNNEIHLSSDYLSLRRDMEKKAETYRDKQDKIAASGNMPIFEPAGTKARNLPHKVQAYRNRIVRKDANKN